MVEKTITEIMSHKTITNEVISRICQKNEINELHIRKVAGFKSQTRSKLTKYLTDNKLNFTNEREYILNIFLKHSEAMTVKDVYRHTLGIFPVFPISLRSVYSTVNVFVKSGIIELYEIKIEDRQNVRYYKTTKQDIYSHHFE